MATKARWFEPPLDLEEDEVDPFATAGKPIEVLDDEARLNDRLGKLVSREARLAGIGVTCAIKERDDTSCWACPVYRGNDDSFAVAGLCRIGREQERILSRLAAMKVQQEKPNDPSFRRLPEEVEERLVEPTRRTEAA